MKLFKNMILAGALLATSSAGAMDFATALALVGKATVVEASTKGAIEQAIAIIAKESATNFDAVLELLDAVSDKVLKQSTFFTDENNILSLIIAHYDYFDLDVQMVLDDAKVALATEQATSVVLAKVAATYDARAALESQREAMREALARKAAMQAELKLAQEEEARSVSEASLALTTKADERAQEIEVARVRAQIAAAAATRTADLAARSLKKAQARTEAAQKALTDAVLADVA
jgi:hypothetical protein